MLSSVFTPDFKYKVAYSAIQKIKNSASATFHVTNVRQLQTFKYTYAGLFVHLVQ